MIGYITAVIPVQIISFVFIPIIAGEIIQLKRSIGGNVKCVAAEIVEGDVVICAARLDLYSPSILGEVVVLHLYPVGSLHVDAGGILFETVVQDLAVCNVFHQNAIGCCAPVF